MRIFGPVVFGFALVLAGPAFASGVGPRAHLNLPTVANEAGAGPIHTVKPGEDVAIACDALTTNLHADVRVVLTLAQATGEPSTGYEKLMATSEHVEKGTVHFRVPDTAGIENHTVHLKVYVVGDKGAQSCDAGMMKIV
jgi:hypothetical protein